MKEFPVDLTAIVSVCDDGSSTRVLREEFNIPAVGDIRRVLVALSETEPLVMDLFNYRFKTTSDLDGHTVGNLLLIASSEITGNLSDEIEALSKVRKIDVVIANDGEINEDMATRYESLEQKDPVELDRDEMEILVDRLISSDYVTVKNNLLRHDVMKLSMHIFGYLLLWYIQELIV